MSKGGGSMSKGEGSMSTGPWVTREGRGGQEVKALQGEGLVVYAQGEG